MTHDEMIAVIQAHKDGKKIQTSVCGKDSDGWKDSEYPLWNFLRCDYRVKPEPRVRYFPEVVEPGGSIVLGAYGFDSRQELLSSCNPKAKPVKFVEALDDDT